MPPPPRGADRNAFSLHNLCAHGRRCGVVPGRWLGPWVMCRALQTTAEAALQVGSSPAGCGGDGGVQPGAGCAAGSEVGQRRECMAAAAAAAAAAARASRTCVDA